MKKIVLTGGGTAGHVTPNIALIPKLQEEGFEIHYIGSKQGIEKELITQEGIPYSGISSGKLRRYASIENLKDPFKVIKGFFEARTLLKQIKPNIVFSKGGYVAVPVVMAAKLQKIPVVIHESDITPGLANKLALKGAKVVCVNFPETLQYVSGKGVLTGTPVRQELLKGNKQQGLKKCGFTEQKPVLLVIGGSLGALKINQVVREALSLLLEDYQIIHICGKGKKEEKLEEQKGYCQFEYVREGLNDLFAASDLVISRAGANALVEWVALQKPNILIPLSQKASRGDQILNAKSMSKQGYSKVIEEEELSVESLQQAIQETFKNQQTYIKAMSKSNQVDGLSKVMEQINKYTQ